MGARPTPGTTELLEVLDRALSGGIVIGSDRRINVVRLGRPTHSARLVVRATETYLGHSEPEAGRPALTAPTEHDKDRVAARRHG